MPPGNSPLRAAARIGGLLGVWAVSGLFPARSAQPAGVLPPPVAPLTVRSVSGQFLVHGERPEVEGPGVVPELRDDQWIDLDPNVLAVIAERVRGVLDRRLGGLGEWRGKIDLTLRPAARAGTGPIQIVPRRFTDGCLVTMTVPDRIEIRRLVRALVEALVLEAANRADTAGVAQAPLWLNEGLAGLVQIEGAPAFLVVPGSTVRREGRRPDPMLEVRSLLAGREPLGFSELGVTRVEDLEAGPGWDRFRASAILLTHEFLREPWGRDGLRALIGGLGRNLNWQTTFLEVFRGRFVSLLEVEKWWAVAAAHELARDPGRQWTPEAVLGALAAIAVEPTEIGADGGAPPVRRQVPLGEVAASWDDAVRRPVLERKVVELAVLHSHADPDLAPFVLAWHEALKAFVDGDRAGAPGRGGLRAGPDRRTRQFLRRLGQLSSELEARRAALATAGG